MTSCVEILAHCVVRARLAVTHIASGVGKREHETPDFGREWMMLPIAGPVQPEHFPRRVRRRQRVQHRQNWSRPDARAEQHDRPLAGLQNEASARRADFESIPPPDMLAQVASGSPIRLELHADSVALARDWTRKRVTAEEWLAAGRPLKTQHDVLSGQSRWQRPAIQALHGQREDVRRLLIDCRDREKPKSWRNRMRRCCRHEPRITTRRCSRVALETRSKRHAPPGCK